MPDPTPSKATPNWEAFRDLSYFDMWCVRRKSDRSFGDGFHILHQEEAERLRDYLEQQDAEMAGLAEAMSLCIKRFSDLSRQLGEAEGRLAASELPGVVEGWKRRAEDAEAEIARLRQALKPFAFAADESERIHGHDGPLDPIVSLQACREARAALSQEPK